MIYSFTETPVPTLAQVGGKGLSLMRLTQAGFSVPPGFCVTTSAFRAFLASDGKVDDLFATLATVDPQNLETLRAAGKEVRAHLGSVAMPPDVAAAVLEGWRGAGPDQAYAVRSSATAEDLPSASFAGQQDTYLNVRGADDLLDSVHRCWISLFSDRAILYRLQNGFDHRDVQIAVVVQQMVEPDVSGILFTADPVSGNRHIVSINASYGLGEALVSGLVSADLYKVDKRSQQEVEAQIGDKQIAIWPLPRGGTERRPVDGAQRRARALPPAQTLALAALGTRIEEHYGVPQDIEWALVGEELTVLQSRPITSLYPLPQPAPQDEALHVYVSFGHPQMMTDPMPPMGLSVLQLMVPFGCPSGALDYNPYATAAGGRIYIDATALLNHPLGKHVLTRFFAAADQLSSDVLRKMVTRLEFRERAKAAGLGASTRGIASWLVPIVGGVLADLWWRNPDGRADEVSAWLEQMVAGADAELAAASPGAKRLAVARRILATRLEIVLRALAHNIGGGFASQLLAQKLAGDRADPEDRVAFMRGLSGNIATEMDLAVSDLADTARRSPALVAHLQQYDALTTLDTLDEVEGGPAFRAQWEQFMASYGMRGPAEVDITRPRWNDDPTSLLQMVLGNVAQAEPGLHRRRHAEMAAEGEAAAARLAEAANHGPAGPLKAAIIRRQTRVARNLMAVREHPKFLLVRIMALVRAALLEAGEMLLEAERIDTAEDIWYLDLIEAIHVMEHPHEELRARIASRKADLDRYRCLTPPRVMTSDGEIPAVSHRRDDLPDGALAGNPVSAGVVEGVAKVVLDPAREQLLPGEILVAPFTDPGWTPLFINAAGLVLEVGGLMTHGSVVAREYGIPAVVGVLDATRLIQTGQRLRVSGDMGFVEILEE
jgi:phosphohistidine swiveling domain-containing protein